MARVTVRHDLDALARRLKKAAASVPTEVDKGLLAAASVVEKKVRASTDTYMPRGYEQTFARALVLKTELKGRNPRRVTLIGRAFGRRGHDRQVGMLEKGLLKHPFWGKWRHVPQAWQRIRPRWMGEPADKATPAAIREIDKAAKRIADHVNKP